MCLNPISIPRTAAGRVVRYDVVPCGKCVECVDRKQKDIMQVFLNVAKRAKSIVFATFTYNDDNIPYRYSVWDYESGSVLCSSFDESELHDQDDFTEVIRTPSLRRSDWRLWLKAARVSYERDTGYKLPPFTYATIGEYGKLHKRPHYHTMFFNLSFELCQRICSSWNKGFTYCESVNLSQSLTSVCRYMAKYLYKGFYESSDVLNQLAEKPRVMASKNLLKIDDVFRDWLIGKDLGISLDTAFLKPSIAQRLLDRRKILIDDFNYRLGNHYINKIFRRYEFDEEGKRKLVSTPLQAALSDFVRSSLDNLRDRELRQAQSMSTSEAGFALIQTFKERDEAALKAREESKCKTLQEYYKRSKL